MTVRVYLGAVRLLDESPLPDDLPAERLFVHASGLPEVWVETESLRVPDRGRAVSFSLAQPMDIGVQRIIGTVERIVQKRRAGVQP